MLIPGILYYIIFRFGPVFGLSIVFFEYMPPLGFTGSPFVGFAHFQRMIADPTFFRLLGNTLMLAFLNLVFFFPIPIILSLLLNEIYHIRYKRLLQSFVYLPHFLSWTVLVSIFYMFLAPSGLINQVLQDLGFSRINFLAEPSWFRPMIVLQMIWKEAGWGTIIYLAALSGVDEQLYEAATIDGATRFQRAWHVTLPSIRSTIVILFILRLGNFLDTGFEQIFLMMNSMNRSVAEVFDTYVYTAGVLNGSFSYASTIGLFKSVIALILVISANKAARKVGEEGIY